MTKAMTLDLLMLLPELPNSHDACSDRVRERLMEAPGIEGCEVVDHDGGPVLVIHYDGKKVGPDKVAHLARVVGDEVTESFGHMLISVPPGAASDAACQLEQQVEAVPGVLRASVSGAGRWVQVEFLRNLASPDSILQRVRELGGTHAKVIDQPD